MLDTEQKIDKFLSDLKVELMSADMKPNEFGSHVEIEFITNKIISADDRLNVNAFPVRKKISITMYIKPISLIEFNHIDDSDLSWLKQNLPIKIIRNNET